MKSVDANFSRSILGHHNSLMLLLRQKKHERFEEKKTLPTLVILDGPIMDLQEDKH